MKENSSIYCVAVSKCYIADHCFPCNSFYNFRVGDVFNFVLRNSQTHRISHEPLFRFAHSYMCNVLSTCNFISTSNKFPIDNSSIDPPKLFYDQPIFGLSLLYCFRENPKMQIACPQLRSFWDRIHCSASFWKQSKLICPKIICLCLGLYCSSAAYITALNWAEQNLFFSIEQKILLWIQKFQT